MLNLEKTDIMELIEKYGCIDGDFHKMWVIDQIVRIIQKEHYDDWVKEYENGEDGPKTYEWDVGIAP